MHLDYDSDADALYIRFNDLPYAFGKDIDAERRIDYAEDDTPIGVELTCVSTGIDSNGLPHESEINRLLEERSFMVFA